MTIKKTIPKIEYKKFAFGEKKLLYDINNFKLYYISNLISDLLKTKKKSKNNHNKTLHVKYSNREIEHGINIINSLKSNSNNFKIIQQPGLIRLFLAVTSECNLNCLYCFCSTTNFKQSIKYMDKKTAKRSIDYLLKKSKRKQIEIYFFGGEPLLNFPTIEYTVRYASEQANLYGKNIKFMISTNGTLLSEKIINFLDEYFSRIALSLDGNKKIQDYQRPYKQKSLSTHDKILHHLPTLLKLFKDRLYISTVVNPNNPQMLNTYRHFKKLGVNHLKIIPCIFSINPEFHMNKISFFKVINSHISLFKEYLQDINRGTTNLYIANYWEIIRDIIFSHYGRFIGCGAGKSLISISPEGEIFACQRGISNPKWYLGNLESGIIKEKQNFYLKRQCNSFQKCKTCWARMLCGGSCMWTNLYINGNKNIPPNHYCQLQKLYITQSIQLINKLFSDNIQNLN